MFRPNFTRMGHAAGKLTVSGVSDPTPAGDLLAITVTVAQGAKTASKAIGLPADKWDVVVSSAGFTAGSAVVVGIESRLGNTTVTWVETMEIPAASND
jgi:hypothetical protein